VFCKTLNVLEYPEKELKGIFKTHLPAELILLAGLRGKLKQRQQESPDFAANWQIVTKWGPEQRYEKVKTASDTQELFDALKAEPDGVLPWLINQS
jgi:hypothetical protein